MKPVIHSLLFNIKIRFLMVGGINTIFGYLVSLYIYSVLSSFLNLWLLLIFINITNITFSYLLHKLLTFKTKGNYLTEYLRCYLANIVNIILGMSIIWCLINIFHFPFWKAQFIQIVFSTVLLFFMHSRFTFKTNKFLIRSKPYANADSKN